MADWNLSTNMIPIGHTFIKDDISFTCAHPLKLIEND